MTSRMLANVQRFLDEKESAAALLDDIVTRPRVWWPQLLRKSHGAMTPGMVHELLRRMMVIVNRSPDDALQFTTMAIEVSEALIADDYPSGMVARARAQALRDHASVLAFMHRFNEARESIERAERAFEGVPAAHYELARLDLAKANALYMASEDSNEAAALAGAASETLLLFDDRSRSVTARIIQGSVLIFGGALDKAFEIWRSLDGDPTLDSSQRVTITHNIAFCLVHLGRRSEAVAPLDECMAEFARLGMSTEHTRARWYLGNALLGTNRQREAILHLRTAWHEFREAHLPVDAALVALDLAEALLVNNEPEQVPMICHEAIAHLTSAGLAVHAMPALTLLREAAAMGKPSPELIRRTHESVRRMAFAYAAPAGR